MGIRNRLPFVRLQFIFSLRRYLLKKNGQCDVGCITLGSLSTLQSKVRFETPYTLMKLWGSFESLLFESNEPHNDVIYPLYLIHQKGILRYGVHLKASLVNPEFKAFK